jgi:hypothetical protein
VLTYSVKLSDIVRNKKTKSCFHSWLQGCCDNYKDFMKLSSEQIENIQNKRQQISNPRSIIHWIAKFKDIHMEKLKQMKPETPICLKYTNAATYLLTHLTDIRRKLLDHNPHLRYYIIRIVFHEKPHKGIVFYKKYNKSHKYASYRKMKEEGPYCVTNISHLNK